MEMHDKGWARFFRCFDEDGCWGEAIGIDGRELWRLSVFHDSEPDLTGHGYLRKLAGRDFEYEIIDVSAWERRDFVARSFRSGRVLIAGDAAHEASPTGGAGMHIGVCEAVNLAWKLAAVLDGWGGGGLLGLLPNGIETDRRTHRGTLDPDLRRPRRAARPGGVP